MKTDRIIAVIAIAFIIIFGALGALLLPRVINKQQPFITKAEIVRFVSPRANPADIAQEYHLWLKIETTRYEFDNLFTDAKNAAAGNIPVEKDEMRTERLATAGVIQDTLFIKGYINEGAITNTKPTGGLLRINKVIILAKENLRPLDDNDSLSNPQTIPRQRFQPQTDIYQAAERDKTLLYIHLESGIKVQKTSDTLSLTLTHLRDNKTIQSQTLPLFSY
ncbi:MAG: hypothetical protein AAB038_00735 [Planctomycetota bacterium]